MPSVASVWPGINGSQFDEFLEGKSWGQTLSQACSPLIESTNGCTITNDLICEEKRPEEKSQHSVGRRSKTCCTAGACDRLSSNKWLHRTMQLEGWGVTVLPKGQTIASIKPTTTNLDTIQQKKTHIRDYSLLHCTPCENQEPNPPSFLHLLDPGLPTDAESGHLRPIWILGCSVRFMRFGLIQKVGTLSTLVCIVPKGR